MQKDNRLPELTCDELHRIGGSKNSMAFQFWLFRGAFPWAPKHSEPVNQSRFGAERVREFGLRGTTW